MDLAWLAALGVLLLVGGLAALAYDTVRRREGMRAYPFPDAETTLISEEEIGAAPLPVRDEDPPDEPSPPVAPPSNRRLLASMAVRRPRLHLPRPTLARLLVTRMTLLGNRKLLLLGVAIALVVLGAGVAALASGSTQARPRPGTFAIVICPFTAAKTGEYPAPTLAGEVKQALEAASVANSVMLCPNRPSSLQQAESTLDRLGADLLVWSPGGNMATAEALLSSRYDLAGNGWQQWSSNDPTRFVLPRALDIPLAASTGAEPLQPLLVSLAELSRGDYSAAERAAAGAQATLESAGVEAQGAALVHAIASALAGHTQEADSTLAAVQGGPLASEVAVNHAAVRLMLLDYPGALAYLDGPLNDRGTPDDVRAQALRLRGEARSASGNLQDALADLDESLRLQPGALTTRLARAQVLYREAQPDLARTELNAVLKADPQAAPAHRLLGLVWLMLGHPDDALTSLDHAASIYNSWAAGLRADEARAQVTGDTTASEEATAGIVAINKEIASVRLYRGMALADKARHEPPESFFGALWRRVRGQQTTNDKAIAELQEAQRLDSSRADILLQMGKVYEQAGDYGRAAEAYKQAAAVNPSAPEPYIALATLQVSQGNPTEAAATLNDLLSRAPATYPAYQQLYDLYNSAGDKAQAVATLQRGIGVTPQSPGDHLWRGKFLLLLGMQDEALGEFQAAAADPAQWEAHLLMGKILEQQGHGPEALSEFQAALAGQPNQPEALLEAGKLLVLAGRGEEAGKLFSRLTTLVPENVEGHIAYSQLLAAEGKTSEAVTEARRAVQSAGNSADAHFALGLAYQADSDWSGASSEFDATVQRDPARFEAFIRWAESLFREDRYAESLKASDGAIKLRADDPHAYRWRAEAQFALRDPDAALVSLGQALKLSPQFPDALALTARCYALKGDLASALHYAQQSAATAHDNPVGLLAVGDVQLAAGQPSDALAAYGQALQLYPGLVEAETGMGRAYAAQGDRDNALKQFKQTLADDPKYAPAHLYTGHLLVEQNRWDDALREYSQAVSARPNWPEALYYLGRAYTQRKDLQNAAQAFQKATDGCPNLVEGWYGLGIARRGLGQRDQAIAALRKATELNAGYAEAWLYLGLTYEETGDSTDAREAFTQARERATGQSTREQAEQGLARVK